MILSDYREVSQIDTGLASYLKVAEVTVTTGKWFWKRSTRRQIARPSVGFWRFVDTGELCPGSQAHELESSFDAKRWIRRDAEAKEAREQSQRR